MVVISAVLHALCWWAAIVTVITYFAAWVERANNPADRPVEQFVPWVSATISMLWEWGTTVFLLLTWPLGLIDLDPAPRRHEAQPPLLLVHGYGQSRAAWLSMRLKLKRRGYRNVFTVALPWRGGSFERYADLIHARVEQLAPLLDDPRFVFVGFSMGGLAVRHYVRRHGAQRLLRAYLVAAPHAGSRLAFAARGEIAPHMIPGSSFLQELAAADGEPRDRYVCIATRFDNRVLPWRSALLDGAGAIDFDFIGHNTMIVSRDVFAAMQGDLERRIHTGGAVSARPQSSPAGA